MMCPNLRESPNDRSPARITALQRKISYHQSAHWLTLVVRPLPLPEPFQFVGTLQDVNLHPETLIQHFPQLRESQQMHDLYEVVIYNGAQRHPIETYWQLWKDVILH